MLHALQCVEFAATFALMSAVHYVASVHVRAGAKRAHEAVSEGAEDTGTSALQIAVSCSTFVYLPQPAGLSAALRGGAASDSMRPPTVQRDDAAARTRQSV